MSSPERVSQQRSNFAEQDERIKRMSTPSWEDTQGALEIRTHNKPRLHSLFENNRGLLKGYYDYAYSAHVKGRKINKPSVEDPHYKIFSHHFRIIRETVSGNIEKRTRRSKISKGMRKHIGAEKSAKKKKLTPQ